MDVSRAANPLQQWDSRIHQKARWERQKDQKMQGKISLAIVLHEFLYIFFPRTSTKSKISGSSLNLFSEMLVGFMVMNPMVESVKNRLKQTKAPGSPKILFPWSSIKTVIILCFDTVGMSNSMEPELCFSTHGWLGVIFEFSVGTFFVGRWSSISSGQK